MSKFNFTNSTRDILLWLGVSLILSSVAQSLAIDAVDPTFNPIIRGPGTVQSLVWNPQGWVYASVSANKINGQVVSSNLIRFNPSTGWDPAYQPTVNGSVSVSHQQSSGKWIVAGSFSSISGHSTQNVARMNEDGTVDESFTASASSLPGSIVCVATDQGGRVIVGMRGYGQQQYVNGNWVTVSAVVLVRLNADGSKDGSFAPVFELPTSSYYSFNESRINAVSVQSDGKILVGGNFDKVGGYTQPFLARLDQTGLLDQSYDPVITFGDNTYSPFNSGQEVQSIEVTAGDVAIIGGEFSGVNGYAQKAVAKITTSGDLDLSFRVFFNSSYSYSWSSAAVYSARQDSQGRVVLVGSWEDIEGRNNWNSAARVDQYGRLDWDFSAPFGNQDRCVILPGDYLVFGRTGSLSSNYVIQGALAGYFSNGSRDPVLNVDLRNSNRPDFFAARAGSGPVIGGTWILEVNGQDITGPTALTSFGQTDAAFNVALNPPASGRSLLKLPSGGYLVGGGFTQCNGISRPRLALCNEDGSTNLAFDLGTGPDSSVDLIRMLPTGKVLIAGGFSKINGIAAKNIALLDFSKLGNTASVMVGTVLEARYGTKTTFADVTTLLQGKLTNGTLSVVASNSAMGGDPASGQSKELTVRYLTNLGERTASVSEGQTLSLPNRPWDSGLIDTAFRPTNSEHLSLTDAAGTPDGKVIIVGSFSTFAGQAIPRMVRLNPDGGVDITFQPQSGFSSFYPETVEAGLTTFWIGGSSLRHTGASSSLGVYRLLANGTRDPSFSCPSFISSTEDLLALLDGRIFAVGSFSSSTAGERKRVARLSYSGAVDQTFDSGDSANSTVNSLALITPSKLYLQGSFSSFQSLDRNGFCLITLQTPVPPQTTIIPLGDKKEGGWFSFMLQGCGEGELIQWSQDGEPIQSANGPTLDFDPLSMLNAGNYTVSVTNTAGTTSPAASLDVTELSFSEWAAASGLSGDVSADKDGDEQSDFDEYLSRTNPQDGSSSFRSGIEVEQDHIWISWPTFPGRRYTVRSSQDLIGWSNAYGPVLGNGYDHEVSFPMPASPSNSFFRVTVEKDQ
jgi:uncharacterized delta-60 repeat protein